MPRTSELSKKQTPKVRGHKTEKHARRDGSVKLRRKWYYGYERNDSEYALAAHDWNLALKWDDENYDVDNTTEDLDWLHDPNNWISTTRSYQRQPNYNPYGLRMDTDVVVERQRRHTLDVTHDELANVSDRPRPKKLMDREAYRDRALGLEYIGLRRPYFC